METKSYASAVLTDGQKTQCINASTNFITSYGIACVRRNNDSNNYEVLMIKKRATYAFVDFLRGRYDPLRHYDLEFMFNEMTITEKILIRGKNFATLWRYCLGQDPVKSSDKSMYTRSMRKFSQLCEHRDGVYLLDLLNKSSNAELLWEIPKGRIGKNEVPIDSAIREFEEETGIKKSAYKLLLSEGTVEYTFSDGGVRYKYIYYLAVMNHSRHPRYDFDNEHMLIEVAELRFLPANAVLQFNNNRLHQTVRLIIKKLKKYF